MHVLAESALWIAFSARAEGNPSLAEDWTPVQLIGEMADWLESNGWPRDATPSAGKAAAFLKKLRAQLPSVAEELHQMRLAGQIAHLSADGPSSSSHPDLILVANRRLLQLLSDRVRQLRSSRSGQQFDSPSMLAQALSEMDGVSMFYVSSKR